MSKYQIVNVKDSNDEWDSLVLNSKQGTIFSLTDYIKNIGLNYKRFYVKKGNDIRAGLCFLINEDDSKIILDDLIIYNGIMFVENDKIKETRAKSERFEITELIIDFLCSKYTSIILQLSPAFEDLRPILWHNYHSENNKDKFLLNLRYTSFVDLHDLFYKKEEQQDNVYLSLDNRRQSDIQKARKSGLSFTEENIPTELFIEFYKKTLSSQGKECDELYLKRMFDLIENAASSNILKKYGVINNEYNITYIVIFGIYNNTGTYIFGAGDENLMERFDATYCLWEAFKCLNHNYGISTIDMEGINSPNRGAFKLDFGGTIQPYYEVKLGE